ncbi:MAG: hypothetical protein JXB07_08965 [Anaerolineae bacterium]|nr:hypothetical protein [Anaerolineae bacterium]
MALYNNSFYPLFGINSLRGQRGQRWADLVDWIGKLPGSDPHVMAFTMTIRRLNRLQSEDRLCPDPFCAVCAAQVVALFDGSEQELLDFYYNNLHEVQSTIRNMRVREVVRTREVVAA